MKSKMKTRGFGDLNLGTRLSIVFFVLISVVFGAFVWASGHYVSNIVTERAKEELRAKTQSVVSLIEVFNADLMREARRSVKVFAGAFPGEFTLDTSSSIDVTGISTPVLMSGGRTVNNDHSYPDKFTSRSGIPATVFARDGNDFIRVSTSLKKADGARAVGTKLNRNHPAYKLLMSGKPYGGVATLFGRKYFTHYEPVKGENGEVVAILFVGLDYTDEIVLIDERVAALKVGDTGSFYAISNKRGKEYGVLQLHATIAGKKYDPGYSIVNLKSADGHEVVKEMLSKANGIMQYDAISENGGTRERMIAFADFPEWGFVIAGGTYTDELTKDVVKMRNLLTAGGVAAVLILAFLLYTMIRRSVSTPLSQATNFARQIQHGDLTTQVEVNRSDEVGQLLQAMNNISQGLANVVWNVHRGASTLAVAAGEISSGNHDLSSRTEEQASSLEETASSMEELTSTVRMNAENGMQANQLASEASEVATKGGAVVSEVVATMGDINESSKKIADIINVIDGIAFQTNILALNAAVEAARAGEQGRGFAVVATEVRSLAQRSANAAQEIKELIEDSVQKVEVGSTLVEQAGSTMTDVVASIRRVNDIMAEITAASREQSDGIEQVNQAIMQMDQVTQQNAALVEQVASSSETMEAQTKDLVGRVGVFKLKSIDVGTADEAVGLVKKAIESMSMNGLQETFEEISDPLGQYVDRDLYVAVYEESGRNVAHGANAKLIGQDLFNAKDGGGKLYVQERIELVRHQTSAWQNYQFLNPVSNEIEPKSMYLEKYQNYIVGCGIY